MVDSATHIFWVPLLPWWLLAFFTAGLMILAVLGRAPFRGGVGLLIVCALSGPHLQKIQYTPEKDIALILTDKSPSNSLKPREALTKEAQQILEQKLGAFKGIEVIKAATTGTPTEGSDLLQEIENTLATLPQERVAGIFMLTDGAIAKLREDVSFLNGVPLHLITTTSKNEKDRKISLQKKPSFTLLNQEQSVSFSVSDTAPTADVSLQVGNTAPKTYTVPTNTPTTLHFTLRTPGQTAVQLKVGVPEGDPIPHNNQAAFLVNGVREALNVLLVSGVPHNGAQALRQLLKSDPALNVVHFTILRTSALADPTPNKDLALIPFPVEDLFDKSLGKFDLIIFDRYIRRNFLPHNLNQNILQHIKNGHGLLTIAGPDFDSSFELPATPLGALLPVTPTGPEQQTPFKPTLTQKGLEHPLTASLKDQQAHWGDWASVLPTQQRTGPAGGHTLLQTPEGLPLIVVNKVEEGRVATLLSNNWWFWPRAVFGGGPYQPLFRNIVHWLLGQPELEEKQLVFTSIPTKGATLAYKGLRPETDIHVTLHLPDGQTENTLLEKAANFTINRPYNAPGLYIAEAKALGLKAYMAIGGGVNKEWASTLNPKELNTFIEKTGGASLFVEDLIHMTLRPLSESRKLYHGPGWLGLKNQGIQTEQSRALKPLLPAWVWCLTLLAALAGLWWQESNKR